MNYTGSDTIRIVAEYERRAREFPANYYLWSDPSNLMTHQDTASGCIKMLDRAALFPLRGQRIADIGCGVGTWLLEFMQWGADPAALCGIDLSSERIAAARERIPRADFRIGCATELPWPDASFDMVSQFTVFTSILDPDLRRGVANEMLRVLKPGGSILWFDFRVNNPNNAQVRRVSAREIQSLFAGCDVALASEVLAPPISRRVARWSRPLASVLKAVPCLRTHYVGLIHKRSIERDAASRVPGE
jgi:ubiquinone/menaquinone biosynthesis C-methylase UbiE